MKKNLFNVWQKMFEMSLKWRLTNKYAHVISIIKLAQIFINCLEIKGLKKYTQPVYIKNELRKCNSINVVLTAL